MRIVNCWSLSRRRVSLCSAVVLSFSLAGTTQAQPTLSKSFNPTTIGPGSVATATFTITNGGGSPVSEIGFIDNLPVVPGPLVIADPANASTTCSFRAGGSLVAPDGGSTISLSGVELGADQACVVSVDVTAATQGIHTNPAITLNSSAGSSMSQPTDLTVATNLPGFSKSFAPSSIARGDRSTLTFTIDNSLNASRVGNLDFVDNLPAGVVVADPNNAFTDCVSAGAPNSTVTAVPGTGTVVLDANGSTFVGFEVLAVGAVCTVTVDVIGNGVGDLDNVTDQLLVDFTAAGKASDTLEVTVTALALDKDFADDPVAPGDTVTLEFQVHNLDRNEAATGVAFNDDLSSLVPALPGLTFSSLLSNTCGGSVTGVGGTSIGFTGGALPAQGSCSIQVSLAVPAGAVPGTYSNTTSAITGDIGGSPTVGNMAADDLFVEPTPVLTKEFLATGTFAPDPVVVPGDDVVLRFTITNVSTTSGATDIAFGDELTDGGPGTGFLPFPVTISLPPVPDPPCGNGSSLSLVSFGTDRQGLMLSAGNLAASPGPGDSCSFDVTLSIPSDLTPGVYTNTTEEITATVDGAQRTGAPASDTLTVVAAPKLTKSFVDDPVAPGQTVTLAFSLTHSANSPDSATAITFTDDLTTVLAGMTANPPSNPDPPCGAGSSLVASAGNTLLTLMDGVLAPGENCAFSITLNVPISAVAGTYSNTTSGVLATVAGEARASQPASDDLTVSGLTFAKEFLGDPSLPGETVTLRFVIDNTASTDNATDIAFTDDLAAVLPGTPDLTSTGAPSVNTCGGTPGGSSTFLIYSGGSLLAGQMCTIEYEILIPAGADDGTFNNTTNTMTATQGGVTVLVDPATDLLTIDSDLLSLSKAFIDDPVAPGDTVTLEFTLANLDASNAATAVAFTDDLNAALTGLTFDGLAFNDCGGSVGGIATQTVSVSGVTIAAGASCTIRVLLSVPANAAAGLYTNTTSDVTGTIGGFAVSGSPASDDLEVLNLLLFSKSFVATNTNNGYPLLNFTITNPGPNPVADLAFSDDLSAVFASLTAVGLPLNDICGAGSQIAGTPFLTFTGGNLPPSGGTCSFDVPLAVQGAVPAGNFTNTTSDLLQAGLKVADPATDSLTVQPPAFSKIFVPDNVVLGGVSTLTFTIDNVNSVFAADNLSFVDNLPSGTRVASPANASTTCTGGTLTASPGSTAVSYAGGTVAAGASCEVEVDIVANSLGIRINTTDILMSSLGMSAAATDLLFVSGPGPCFANDGEFLQLQNGAVTDNQAYEVCNTILVAPDFVVFGSGGSLNLTAGLAVVFQNGFEILPGGELSVSLDAGLLND